VVDVVPSEAVACTRTTFGFGLASRKPINFWKSPLRGIYAFSLVSCVFYLIL